MNSEEGILEEKGGRRRWRNIERTRGRKRTTPRICSNDTVKKVNLCLKGFGNVL